MFCISLYFRLTLGIETRRGAPEGAEVALWMIGISFDFSSFFSWAHVMATSVGWGGGGGGGKEGDGGCFGSSCMCSTTTVGRGGGEGNEHHPLPLLLHRVT